jgi:DNA ligase-1
MHQIIAKLESDNSRLFKESVIAEEMANNNTEFFEGIKLCLSPFVTFGVKKVPTHGGPDGQGLPWGVFAKLADQLAKRELTGHDARDAIELCLKTAKQDEWNFWYRRILIKDLRCGVSEKTINNVAKKQKRKEFEVPLFTCQLAHGFEDHESKATGKRYVEVKLDGVRVLTIVYPDGRVDQYSRNGKELVNFEHIKEQISKTASQFGEAVVLDGEVMSASFQDLMKQVHRKDNVSAGDAVLHLFDIVSLKDFQLGKSKVRQEERSERVYKWHKANKDALPNVAVVGHELVDLSTSEGKKRFKVINQSAIEGGYEGIMIKDPDAAYECKRTTSWLKLKPFIEVSLGIQTVEEGTGRNEGRLGAFVCEGEDDGKNIRVNVGSGFSDSDRDVFWTSRPKLIGQIVEVRADAITQNQDGSYSLRFPRFLRFRGFEVGEKL